MIIDHLSVIFLEMKGNFGKFAKKKSPEVLHAWYDDYKVNTVLSSRSTEL